MKTVLYIQSPGKLPAIRKLEGVLSVSRRNGWRIRRVDECEDAEAAKSLAEFWRPDGIIVECGSERNLFPPTLFGATPVVFLDRNPDTLGGFPASVAHDSAATARAAARELLSLDLETYGYVPWPKPRFWSDERERGFSSAIALNGKRAEVFRCKSKERGTRGYLSELRSWLASLKKPAGIMAANDEIAADVLAELGQLGIAVPGDAAVVGVDNSELVCENTMPTLSSIEPDFRLAGEKAAEMLGRMMSDPRYKAKPETFGPLRLVRRASSFRTRRIDRDVLAALDLIRREACAGLTARDALRHFKCSRRMAEIRFRAVTGTSPLAAIQDVRRKRALEMLKDPSMDRNAIANMCGYSSANALCNFLRKTKRTAAE